MTLEWEILGVFVAILIQSMGAMYWAGRMTERIAELERLLIIQTDDLRERTSWKNTVESRLTALETKINMQHQ
ncbi:MAG: hypothetical protein AAFQ04_08675 [Pseudomonadota bacterium]